MRISFGAGVTGDSPPQEIRPPSQKGGDIPRIFAPPGGGAIFLGISPPGGRKCRGGENPGTPVV
jgi:hypothetical protein